MNQQINNEDKKAIRESGISKINSNIMDTTLFIDELIKWKLTPKELIILSCIIRGDHYNMYRYLYDVYRVYDKKTNSYILDKSQNLNIAEINKLENDGWITRNSDFEKYLKNPDGFLLADCFDISDEAIARLFIKADIAAKQVYESYPKTMEINGRYVSSLTIGFDDFIDVYAELIGATTFLADKARNKKQRVSSTVVGGTKYKLDIGFIQRHNLVMQGLNKYKELLENGTFSPVGIDKFIKSRVYEVVLTVDSVGIEDFTNPIIRQNYEASAGNLKEE